MINSVSSDIDLTSLGTGSFSSGDGDSKVSNAANVLLHSPSESLNSYSFSKVVIRDQVVADLETRRMAHLKTIFKVGLSQADLGLSLEVGDERSPDGVFLDFRNRNMASGLFKQINTLYFDLKNEKIKKVSEVRARLNQIFSEPSYQDFKNKDHIHINFVQLLSIKMQMADGLEDLKTHFPLSGGVQNFQEFRGKLQEKIGELPFSKTKGVKWFASNPKEVASSLQSKVDSKNYTPFSLNPSHKGYVFEGKTGKIQSFFAPSPTGDKVWEEGVVPALKKLNLYEVFFNYQDYHVSDEKNRIDQAEKISARSDGVLKHCIMGYDAKVKSSLVKPLMEDTTSIKDFLGGYTSHIENHCRNVGMLGMKISEGLLSKEMLQEELSRIKNITFEGTLGEKKQAVVMLIDALLASRIIENLISKQGPVDEKRDSDFQYPFMRACCKQHVDRGTVQLSAMYLIYELRKNPDYTLEEEAAKDIAAAVQGRAVVVDNRKIIPKKADRFFGFLTLLDKVKNQLFQTKSSHGESSSQQQVPQAL